MDENARRRYQWKRSLSKWLKTGESDEDDDEEGGLKISMHGRLMVQPSRRVFKDLSNSEDSGRGTEDEEDLEEKRREETQYRLTTMKKRVSYGHAQMKWKRNNRLIIVNQHRTKDQEQQ